MSLLVSLATARLSGIYIIILTLALQVTIEKTFFSNITLIETDPDQPIPRPAFLGVSLNRTGPTSSSPSRCWAW